MLLFVMQLWHVFHYDGLISGLGVAGDSVKQMMPPFYAFLPSFFAFFAPFLSAWPRHILRPAPPPAAVGPDGTERAGDACDSPALASAEG